MHIVEIDGTLRQTGITTSLMAMAAAFPFGNVLWVEPTDKFARGAEHRFRKEHRSSAERVQFTTTRQALDKLDGAFLVIWDNSNLSTTEGRRDLINEMRGHESNRPCMAYVVG